MAVFGASHLPIGVSDMDKVLPFYTRVLGFNVVSDFIQDIGPDQGRDLHGGRHIRRRQVWLRQDDKAHSFAIALDEMSLCGPSDHRADIYDLGIHHIGLWVDNIQEIVQRAREGGHPVVMPHTSSPDGYGDDDAEGRIASVFLRDPEGNLIQCDQRIREDEFTDWHSGSASKYVED